MNAEPARQSLFECLESAVQDKIAPGFVAYVERDGACLYHEAHGHFASWDGGGSASRWVGRPLVRDAIFDLASLTKVLCTTTLVAQLVESGRIQLDDVFSTSEAHGTTSPTWADVLSHCAGYAAHRPYYCDFAWPSLESRRQIMHRVRREVPEYPKQSRAVYSDLGFIQLGFALEEIYGVRLDELWMQQVGRPLGLDRSTESWMDFLPLDRPEDTMPALNPDLICPSEVYRAGLYPDANYPDYFVLRSRWAGDEGWARGEVHDDNAYCMLGVAGHAGLFGTARSVVEVARAWLHDPSQLGISPILRDRCWQRSLVSGSSRCLGFDGVDLDGNGLTGRALSSRAIGHVGFPGTSLWIDPQDASIYVLLCHRVHPKRGDGTAMRKLRRMFHEHAARLVRS